MSGSFRLELFESITSPNAGYVDRGFNRGEAMIEKISLDGKKIRAYFSNGELAYEREKVGGHMHQILPEGKVGKFQIKQKIATEEDVKYMKIRSIMNYSAEYQDFEPGTYTMLLDEFNNIVMSDTPMEIKTNDEFIKAAHGDVLIAGLGLGVVLLEIQKKPEVTSIVVVEKFRDVISLVKSKLPLSDKVKIVSGDIHDWNPQAKSKFDVIYLDIWTNVPNADQYKEMLELHKRFRKFLNRSNPNKWINSWRFGDAKRSYFYEKAHDPYYRSPRNRSY